MKVNIYHRAIFDVSGRGRYVEKGFSGESIFWCNLLTAGFDLHESFYPKISNA